MSAQQSMAWAPAPTLETQATWFVLVMLPSGAVETRRAVAVSASAAARKVLQVGERVLETLNGTLSLPWGQQ